MDKRGHLVITVKKGEHLIINDNIEIRLKDRRGHAPIAVRASIFAPKEIIIQKVTTEGTNENTCTDVHLKKRKTQSP